MAIGTRSYARSYAGGGSIPPGVKALLIANAALFLAIFFLRGSLAGALSYLALTPAAVVKSFALWQPGTYLFLHTGIWSFVFNMLALWMFGRELELAWGTRRFVQFYFLCGAGAGVCVIVAAYLFGDPFSSTIGSNAAIYGILAASAALWPDREVLFSFLFPMKMKYFVLLIAAIVFLSSFGSSGQMALLTGLLFGYGYVKTPRMPRFDPVASIQSGYRNWKLQRAKRKFQVYLRKKGSDR